MKFTEFLKDKCREETGCIKDNWQESWELFLEDLLDEENKLDNLAVEWKAEEVNKWVELADTAINELQKIKNLLTPNQ